VLSRNFSGHRERDPGSSEQAPELGSTEAKGTLGEGIGCGICNEDEVEALRVSAGHCYRAGQIDESPINASAPRDVDSPDDDNERTQSGPDGDSVPGDLPPWTVVYQKTQRWMRAGVFEILVEDVRSLLPSSLCFRMPARTPAPRIRAISASAPSAICSLSPDPALS
jgi:hypothetical protein